jgi:glycosyltransferase involved in cell wall biosynthesis
VKVLACHNYYLQAGGEDQSYASEIELLQSRGHEVQRFTIDNEVIAGMSRVEVAVKTVFNRQVFREIKKRLQDWQPDIVHCTNTFPLISPAIYYAAYETGVPVVQSLRNYRLLCPNAYLLRCGSVCEKCLTKTIKWPAVQHACYRKSRAASAVVATMLATHKILGTWDRYIDRYFAMTEFAKAKFVAAGFPESKIAVKPNFLFRDPGPGTGDGDYAVFVGRLSPEKGLDSLLPAWQMLPIERELRIIGDGPMADDVQRRVSSTRNVKWLGALDSEKVLEQIGAARVLILPSTWYEGMPRTIIEAFSRGTPVIAFGMGAMQEIIRHSISGLLVKPGDIAELAEAINQSFAWEPTDYQRMRSQCRSAFLESYSSSSNYEMLMQIYREAKAAKQLDSDREYLASSRSFEWQLASGGHSYE